MDTKISGHRMKSTSRGRRRRESLKVVYISSPMKVKTCASKFRALVQELTGRHSDVSRLMELDGADQQAAVDGGWRSFGDDESPAPPEDPFRDSPASSDTVLDPLDEVFNYQNQQFCGFFNSSSLFYDPSRLDALGSYDTLV